MSFFGRLFGRCSSVDAALERRLLEQYSALLASSGVPDPLEMAEAWLAGAKEGGVRPLLPVQGPGAGAQLLSLAAKESAAHRYVELAREDGVRDDDFETWWSLHELERRMVIQWDRATAMKALMLELARSKVPGEAVRAVRKVQPLYGYPLIPASPNDPIGQDRFLPYELKDRVNGWILRPNVPGAVRPPSDVSSMNAYVRQLVLRGDL